MKVFCFSCNHINVLFLGRLLALIQSVHFYRQLFNAFLPFPNKQLVIGVFSLSLSLPVYMEEMHLYLFSY